MRVAIVGIAVAALLRGVPLGAQSPLGANLGQLADFSGEWPFVDQFKTSRPWVESQLFGCGYWQCPPAEAVGLDLDEHGWVRSLDGSRPNGGQVARTILYAHPDPMNVPADWHPLGTFVVLYDGDGELQYSGAGTRVAALPGRDLVAVGSSAPLIVTLVRTNPLDYLRNIRILPPGGACADDPYRFCAGDADCDAAACQLFVDHHAAQVFHPTFLSHLRGVRLIRLMQWMNTNDFPIAELDDYPVPEDARWLTAPAEIMAELANRLDADLWVTPSHLVSDELASGLAVRLHARLEPRRRVFVEYSNEVWNAIYPQHDWVRRRGCELYPDLFRCDDDAVPGDGIDCQWAPPPSTIGVRCQSARIRYFARRSREVWALFRAAFDDPSRVVRVLGSQVGQGWMHREALDWDATAGDADLVATAPYFGGVYGGNRAVAGWTLDQLFADLTARELPAVVGWMQADAGALAGYPGVGLAAYEGGQHLVVAEFAVPDAAERRAMNTLFDQANRDPRMGGLYETLLDGWRARGGGLFAHYLNVGVWSVHGRFGALEYQDQSEAGSAKFRSLADFAAANPCWWSNCAEPPIFGDGFEAGTVGTWSLARTP